MSLKGKPGQCNEMLERDENLVSDENRKRDSGDRSKPGAKQTASGPDHNL
jgi:hypothetical protein